MEDRFYEFEEYYFRHNLNSFCEKVFNIVVTLLAYYDASGVMTEFPDRYIGDYKKLYDESVDIAKKDFENISDTFCIDKRNFVGTAFDWKRQRYAL